MSIKITRTRAAVRVKGQTGLSTLEAVLVGSLVLLPILALFLDAAVFIGASMANQSLADHAARAAATYQDTGLGQQAALYAVSHFPKSTLIPSVKLDDVGYYPLSDDGVFVHTTMNLILPVPLPAIPASMTLTAKAWQPITAVRPGTQIQPPAKLPQNPPAAPAGGSPGLQPGLGPLPGGYDGGGLFDGGGGDAG